MGAYCEMQWVNYRNNGVFGTSAPVHIYITPFRLKVISPKLVEGLGLNFVLFCFTFKKVWFKRNDDRAAATKKSPHYGSWFRVVTQVSTFRRKTVSLSSLRNLPAFVTLPPLRRKQLRTFRTAYIHFRSGKLLLALVSTVVLAFVSRRDSWCYFRSFQESVYVWNWVSSSTRGVCCNTLTQEESERGTGSL
jgi:hypothetical protein